MSVVQTVKLYQFAHPAPTLFVIMGGDLTRIFSSDFRLPCQPSAPGFFRELPGLGERITAGALSGPCRIERHESRLCGLPHGSGVGRQTCNHSALEGRSIQVADIHAETY